MAQPFRPRSSHLSSEPSMSSPAKRANGNGSGLLTQHVVSVVTAMATGLLLWKYRHVKRQTDQLITRQHSLEDTAARDRSLVQHRSEVVLIVAPDGKIKYQGPANIQLWGYAPDALEQTVWTSLIHPDDAAQLELLLGQAEDCPATNMSVEARLRYADGLWHTCEVIVNNLNSDAKVAGIMITMRDITERKRYEEQLTRLAFHDPLSNLPNRALFIASVQHAIARSVRLNRQIAVLFLDLDNFKVVNDSLGHQYGDQLLVAVAERLRACIRPLDIVARLGGDEFTILLEDVVEIDQAVQVAERIQEQLLLPFFIGGHELFTGASIGITMSASDYDHPEELVRDADLAMYSAKTGGKASYVVFDRSLGDRVRDRLSFETDLRHAIELGQFQVHYQPVVNLDSQEICEVEALVRWLHPTRGMVLPEAFISIAEETGLIVPIGQFVLEEACRQAVTWQQSYPTETPLVVSVNLSPRQFQDAKLVQMVAQSLQMSGLAPACLKLEITESMMMQDSVATAQILRDLKRLGVQLAIDDFGTGYCSLNYLKRFPVDTLKIDRSFIYGLGRNPEDTAIVRAVIAFAKALNLSVTGEGIENAHQVAELNALLCDRGQGYFFGKPAPHEAVELWYAQMQGVAALATAE